MASTDASTDDPSLTTAATDGEQSPDPVKPIDEQIQTFIDRLAVYDDPAGSPTTPPSSTSLIPPPSQPSKNRLSRPRANGSLDLSDVPPGDGPSGASTRTNAGGLELPTVLAVFIESAAEMPDGADSMATGTANMALEAAAASKGLPIDDYVKWLEARVAKSPQDIDARWRLAFQQLALGRSRNVVEAIAGADEATAERMQQVFDLIAALRHAAEDPANGSTKALATLDVLRLRLADQADLRVPTVEFCTRVAAFGVYDALPDAQLLPFQSNRVIVYLEVDNFSSRHIEDQPWRTVLASRMEVLTADGQSLWTHSEPEIEDLSQRRRRDFFLAQLITLPPSLGPGNYVFKVSVEDVQAAKVAEAVRPFTIRERSSLTYANPR
ncbi:MAG: hypothetical protein IID37_02645 [Planctomycetes bacterium]|nr:hypothetical protein [Planctomycetota bacterium]